MTEEQIIKERLETPLSDADLKKHTGIDKEDIIKYSDLKNYNRIQELLPKVGDFRIILIEDRFNAGHWVLVMRTADKTIEYFNSYGAKWDTDWKFITRMARVILGQNTNEMTRLMDIAEQEGFSVVWNNKKLQKLGSKIQTCGRWCVMRIETYKMGYTTPRQFQDLIGKFKTEMGGNSDYVVAKYVA
jgi:hypothetical protein